MDAKTSGRSFLNNTIFAWPELTPQKTRIPNKKKNDDNSGKIWQTSL